MNARYFLYYFVMASLLLGGCKKYLEAKTNKSLVEPSTLTDAQSLLDNYPQMNVFFPSIAAESEDDHFLLANDYNSLNTQQRQNYIWDVNAFYSGGDDSWNYIYASVLIANMSLETVAKVDRTTQNASDWDRIKGEGLFFRAFNFFYALQYWSAPYDSSTASAVAGIPLRMTSDVNESISRPPQETGYQQVITDLKEAVTLLPNNRTQLFRPSKAAAFGALARVYLTRGDYSQALTCADSCLALYATLIDYNTVDASARTPFQSFNDEVIFHAETLQNRAIYSPTAKTDTNLYSLYDSNDLRKGIFFYSSGSGYYSFKGSYAGSNYYDVPFFGIATDEQFLIKAECEARLGDANGAMNTLNSLLIYRWKQGSFTPLTAADASDALRQVIRERRKELVGRAMRWFDLRRLNREPAFATNLIRVIGTDTYQLPANDPRYTFFIPDVVIQTSAIQQNTRQ